MRKVETVHSGTLEHLLEQVTELQNDMEVVLRELMPLKHEAMSLTEATDLDKS